MTRWRIQGHSGGTAEEPAWPIRRGKVGGKIETTKHYRVLWVIWVFSRYLSCLSYLCVTFLSSSSKAVILLRLLGLQPSNFILYLLGIYFCYITCLCALLVSFAFHRLTKRSGKGVLARFKVIINIFERLGTEVGSIYERCTGEWMFVLLARL